MASCHPPDCVGAIGGVAMQAWRRVSLYVVDGGSEGRMLPQTSPTNTRVSGDCVQVRASSDGQRLHDTVRVRHQ
jgi:hypothetical protein